MFIYISIIIFVYSILFLVYFYKDITGGISNSKKFEEIEEYEIKAEFLKRQNIDEEYGNIYTSKRNASIGFILKVTNRFSLRLNLRTRKKHTSNLTIYYN